MEKLGNLFLAIIVSLYKAFVFTFLWVWFIVPFGAPELTLMWSMGIILVVTTLTHQYKPSDDFQFKDFIHSMIVVSITWGLGWIYHALM